MGLLELLTLPERVHRLEVDMERQKIERLLDNLKKDDGNPYKVEPAGKTWHYHHVTAHGDIIEKG